MPFKNADQMKACYAKKAEGKNGSWDCDEWAKKTPKNIRSKAAKTESFEHRLDEVFGLTEDKWLQKASKEIEDKGTEGVFSAKAKKAGMSTKEYAAHVMANKDDFDPKTIKQANFAKNAIKASK